MRVFQKKKIENFRLNKFFDVQIKKKHKLFAFSCFSTYLIQEDYIPPSDDAEAEGQNCCGRCEKKACRSEELCLTVNLTKTDC